MSNRTQRLCNWLSVNVFRWRTPRTAVSTVARGHCPSLRTFFGLVILGLSGGLLQWHVGREEARQVQLGLMVPEQALAQIVAASQAPPTSAAVVTSVAVDTASTTNTVPAAPVAPVTVALMPSTESDTSTMPSQACVSSPLVPAATDVSVDTTVPRPQRSVASPGTRRRQTTSRQQQRRHVVRLAPPCGLSVLAVASRSALLRLPQGSVVTVQAGARLQGWTVERFSAVGMMLTHNDQRVVLSLTAEPRQRR